MNANSVGPVTTPAKVTDSTAPVACPTAPAGARRVASASINPVPPRRTEAQQAQHHRQRRRWQVDREGQGQRARRRHQPQQHQHEKARSGAVREPGPQDAPRRPRNLQRRRHGAAGDRRPGEFLDQHRHRIGTERKPRRREQRPDHRDGRQSRPSAQQLEPTARTGQRHARIALAIPGATEHAQRQRCAGNHQGHAQRRPAPADPKASPGSTSPASAAPAAVPVTASWLPRAGPKRSTTPPAMEETQAAAM